MYTLSSSRENTIPKSVKSVLTQLLSRYSVLTRAVSGLQGFKHLKALGLKVFPLREGSCGFSVLAVNAVAAVITVVVVVVVVAVAVAVVGVVGVVAVVVAAAVVVTK